jgi:RND superfamily putative drug exporter
MYHGTAHVILGSGLTIAGATSVCTSRGCRTSKRSAYPGDRHARGCRRGTDHGARPADDLQSLRPVRSEAEAETRGWRAVGTAVVRWPGPDPRRVGGSGLVGLLALPSYKPATTTAITSPDIPANVGYAAADRHFPAGPG